MVESPASATELLRSSKEVLRQLADANHDQQVPASDQRVAEHAIAVGIAELAGEPRPADVDEDPTRPILARDMLITVDLVLRAIDAANG